MRRIQVHATISGALAGTSFRSMIRRQAEKLSITGWVIQHPDGELEGVFNGSERSVRVFLNWCERGPMAEAVSGVVSTPQPREAFMGFSVRTPPPSADAGADEDEDEDAAPDQESD
ncbi:MAG: acylphosphatase [Myxococcales bacterium]|nr:acylphosphatase [Myxococcales bacterium]